MEDQEEKERKEKAEKILIGIADAIRNGIYTKGFRNNIAVDFAIACSILGLDPYDQVVRLHLSMQSKLSVEHVLNFKSRLRKIDDYLPTWQYYDVMDYALMPDEWIRWYDNTEVHAFNIAVD